MEGVPSDLNKDAANDAKLVQEEMETDIRLMGSNRKKGSEVLPWVLAAGIGTTAILGPQIMANRAAEAAHQQSIAEDSAHNQFVGEESVRLGIELFEELGRMPSIYERNLATSYSMNQKTGDLRELVAQMKVAPMTDLEVMEFDLAKGNNNNLHHVIEPLRTTGGVYNDGTKISQ